MTNVLRSIDRVTKVLEDLFFYSEDLKLRKQYEALQKETETIEILAKVSGIVNKDLLRELLKLNIRPETLTAIALVPIIQVAWADGKIDKQEIDALSKGASKIGIGNDQVSQTILSEWLSHKPDTALYDAWTNYMKGLCEIMSKENIEEMKKDIIGHARQVAESAGGFLGLVNKISKSEQEILDRLETFFKTPGPCCN